MIFIKMIGVILFNNKPRTNNIICKSVHEFNDCLRFMENSYGVVYKFNPDNEKMISYKQCYYDIKLNIYKVFDISEHEYIFENICLNCQKNNDMYGILKPCHNCIYDTCKFCGLVYVDCICDKNSKTDLFSTLNFRLS
jgi:hypothetical protein